MKIFIFSLILFLSYPLYCQNNSNTENLIQQTIVWQDGKESWADSVFNSLSPDERIAQLFMIASYSNRDEFHVAEISDLIRKYNIGGIIFFQGTPLRQANMTNYFQSVAKTPLFIGIDGEWGLYMRLDSTQWFPRHMMLGALSDNRLIYELGNEFARQMKAIGIHINFAPVVDINSNPLNPVISNRSFGENKEDVAEKAIKYAKGMQDNGVMAVAKHFPGHGDTDADSHFTLPVINRNFTRIDTLEFYPFRKLIENKVGGIMVAHLKVPTLDSTENLASSLSPKIVNGLLRNYLNYQGLIFTDALNMKGASDLFAPGELEVRALIAGNDVLLMPSDLPKAIKAIKLAIDGGRLSQSQIDSSCLRILKAKEWWGLQRYSPCDLSIINEKLNTTNAIVLQRKIVASAITVVQNRNNILPLKDLDTLRLAVLLTGTTFPNKFIETLQLYSSFDYFYLPQDVDSAKSDSLLYLLRHYNLVIVSTHNTDSRTSMNFGLNKHVVGFIDTLAAHKKIIFNLLATPYALSLFKNVGNMEAIIVGYHDMPAVQDITAQVLFGGISATGKMPVTASSYLLHTSYFTPTGFRFRYALPEEMDIKTSQLLKIDSIVNSAITQYAMPGCQIFAAKNGVVFYNKSFGYHTYDSIRKVENSDLYDIASVTKIAATVPSLMRLYEIGDIKLKNKLSSYLHGLKKTNKKDITLIDILTHQARLQPYIAFYLSTLEPANSGERLFSKEYSSQYSLKLANSLYINKNVSLRKPFYSKIPDIEHGVKVADDLYISNSYSDSIFRIIANSDLLPEKQYKYSDLGYYFLFRLIEQITHTSLNEYVVTNFYKKLGASTLGYLPLSNFELDRIVPTENDLVFRKQIVQGYVHDQGAAMLGGVCGHAGLFSNANDLAKLMQVFLNNGSYGGEEYFKKSTIDYFTSCQFCKTKNRRGIGFDKPDLSLTVGPTCHCVSEKSYGHSGFTGTYAWADPETGLLYIFLSNRVFPDATNAKLSELNVRTEIHEILTKAIQ